jgi:putative membrane protein
VSSAAFFDDAAKRAVRTAIERIEKQTCAEVVVTVRREAGRSYRDVELACGAVAAFVVLLLLLFLPKEFSTTWMPLDVALAFGLGVFVCRQARWLKRLLISRTRRHGETRRAAFEAFHELGIGRTSGRHGILVCVGVFERQVVIVPDVNVEPALLRDATAKLEAAVERANPSVEHFVAALELIGPALAKTLPCRDDDVNELSDEVGEQ